MYNDAYQFLHEIREDFIYILNKSRELRSFDCMIGISGIDYNPDKVQSSPRQDALELKAIRHMEAIKELKADIAEAMERRAKRIDRATELISKMESREQQDVLIMRYIEHMNWSEILDKRDCDNISSQYELHKRALASFQHILDDERKKAMGIQ